MSLTLTRSTFDEIVATTDEIDGLHLRADYIGRGMNAAGNGCLALICDDGTVTGLVRWTFALTEMVSMSGETVSEEVASLVDAMRDYRTRADQLGHGLVYYWPEVGVALAHADYPHEPGALPDCAACDDVDDLEPNGNV